MRFFSEAQVAELVGIDDAIEAVEQAFALAARGEATNRPRERVGGSGRAWLHLMGAAIWAWDVMGFKAYVSGPSGARFMVFLFGATSGEPLAAMEAARLGQLRTGAASAVAARRMARPDSRVMALFGCGQQAETQLLALAAVLPLEQVWVLGRRPERVAAFCSRMQERLPRVRLSPGTSPEQAVAASDVVTTVTTSKEPVVLGRWLKPGVHLNAVGSNHPARRELDAEAVLRADRVVVDDLAQARREAGDLLGAEARGFAWSAVLELASVVEGRYPGRTRPDEITLFESQGVALEDVALGARVLERARRVGHGGGGPGGQGLGGLPDGPPGDVPLWAAAG